mgnify:FL=1|jgi:hypothetical protein
MKRFLDLHEHKTVGTLSCFDRVLFKGHLPVARPEVMANVMKREGAQIRDFKEFVGRYSAQVADHARQTAAVAGRPVVPVARKDERKEDLAREIAVRDGIADGLVCVITALEPVNSFNVRGTADRGLRLVPGVRKCNCFYYYFLDPALGLLHVRITSWFPFTVQVCVQGHDYVALRLRQEGVGFEQVENAFVRIDDWGRAQEFADELLDFDWTSFLDGYARQANPLLDTLLGGDRYRWVTEQAEYSTDVVFRDPPTLQPLYDELLRHAHLAFGAEDIMGFLGRKLHSAFQGELATFYKRRWPGARVRHQMKGNWLKMYAKHGLIVRVETVINRPYEFKVRRWGKRKGQSVHGWFPMAKGVANFRRYAEVSLSANNRYLDALAVVKDPREARESLAELTAPAVSGGRRCRGFNPLAEPDLALFAAVLKGDHLIQGFRNRHLRELLFGQPADEAEQRRQSARVTRLLRILHAHKLVAKVPRTRCWRVSVAGHRLLPTVIKVQRIEYPEVYDELNAS